MSATVVAERAAISQGDASWDTVLHEWFRVRDITGDGSLSLAEYIALNKRMHLQYYSGDVPFDEQVHTEKFKLLDTNQASWLVGV